MKKSRAERLNSYRGTKNKNSSLFCFSLELELATRWHEQARSRANPSTSTPNSSIRFETERQTPRFPGVICTARTRSRFKELSERVDGQKSNRSDEDREGAGWSLTVILDSHDFHFTLMKSASWGRWKMPSMMDHAQGRPLEQSSRVSLLSDLVQISRFVVLAWGG